MAFLSEGLPSSVYNRLLGSLFVKTAVEPGVSFFTQGGKCRPSYSPLVDPRDLSSHRRNVKHISGGLIIYRFRFGFLSTISLLGQIAYTSLLHMTSRVLVAMFWKMIALNRCGINMIILTTTLIIRNNMEYTCHGFQKMIYFVF